MTTYGTLEGISLAGFLRMVQTDKKDNLSLEISNQEGKTGVVYCRKGKVYDALTTDKNAEEALVEMILWKENISIIIRNQYVKIKKIIKKDLCVIVARASQEYSMILNNKIKQKARPSIVEMTKRL